MLYNVRFLFYTPSQARDFYDTGGASQNIVHTPYTSETLTTGAQVS